mgnify:FL=1
MTMEPAVSEKLHPYHCQDGDQDAGPASNDAGIGEHHGGDYVEGNAPTRITVPMSLLGDATIRSMPRTTAAPNRSSNAPVFTITAMKKQLMILLTTK